ncbi:fibrous sheath-interacting protein 1 isoform X2 [Betta splendens]|uniref:Fibrous sheath-interacting protein 1 n=1 Tax=Betta splendens TaxID=158456 RepID=A0A6P7LM54_BETSP|nr:fibrous sheath-interacting protein 1 isoform X2 [Betta splendens]
MEIIKGSLDEISRAAPTEHTGSRVSSVSLPHADRICPTPPFSLVVLTNDAADIQNQSSSEETTNTSSDRGEAYADVTADEEASKLQKEIEEMQRLDKILSQKISREKEVKRQRKELQAKLWQDILQQNTTGRTQCAQEALNTKLFLALEAPAGTEEQEHCTPLFETQVTDCDEDDQDLEKSEKTPRSSTEQFDVGHCGSSKGRKTQNFVKRNIELVSGGEGQVLLTQPEKERLAKLLRELEEEEEESGGGGSEEIPGPTSQGYSPEPSDLQQLIHIESRLRLLSPEDFHSARSSCTSFSGSRGRGSDLAWTYQAETMQYVEQRREDERRLDEVQQQLELLGRNQDATDESPALTEEQLLSLLDECELMEGWSADEANDTSTQDC